MAVFDLYSKRQKLIRGDVSDVYTYDEIPEPLRVQIVHIWNDALGDDGDYIVNRQVGQAYAAIVDLLCREYGVFQLCTLRGNRNHYNELLHFFINEREVDKVVDVIEVTFKCIDDLTRQYGYMGKSDSSSCADVAIKELNERFMESSVGFQFTDGQIVRVDSGFIHAEVVKPVLSVLNDCSYAGAQSEFLKAHEHYRCGNNKESLVECLKSFESVMKSICDKRKWSYAQNAPCKALIDICFTNGLIPLFWQQHFSALRSTMESGVPTGRNKLGGHGQGSEVVDVPRHIVAYVLHMTAACIVFLVDAEKSMQ